MENKGFLRNVRVDGKIVIEMIEFDEGVNIIYPTKNREGIISCGDKILLRVEKGRNLFIDELCGCGKQVLSFNLSGHSIS